MVAEPTHLRCIVSCLYALSELPCVQRAKAKTAMVRQALELRGGAESLLGVIDVCDHFPNFRAFHTVVFKRNFQKSP